MDDRISVIVPVYNVEQYLKRAIDSLLGQTYKNLQIVLVDDGSPDRCGQICDAYARQDERVRVIHKENGGLSSARNAGIDIADGTYIAFFDSDDYYCPGMLERLLQVAREEKCDIVQCGFYRFSDTPEHEPVAGAVQLISAKQALDRIDNSAYMAACNKLYKTELFQNIRFPEGKIHEDVGTTYRLFYEAEKIAVIPDALYGYFVNADSITTGKIKANKLDLLDVYAEQIAFFRQKGLEKNMYRAANNLAASFGTLLCYDKDRYADYKTFSASLQEKFSKMRKEVLRGVPLRWDLKMAILLSCGNVKIMAAYHRLKSIQRK